MDKKRIQKIIMRLKNIDTVKKSKHNLTNIQRIESRLNEDVFKLAVVGEFSSGKSTFINAIIGMDLLSHSTEETTATVTYINNVSLIDDRLNTCKVNYKSGKSIIVNNLSKLPDYTTAQSDNNVASEIASVEVYVNFLNVDYPIMIIDTPGLNGVADKHREITIEEIKKVHACIYLLPLKGISKTDIDFIYILQQYQSRFIFIQNFRDALNFSEGETSEFKIEQITSILKQEFFDNNISFEIGNPICLSALLALVSKDKDIDRLYNDSPLLNDDERKLLYENSKFVNFENTLITMIESGEYKNTILSSALRALEQIVNNIINDLNDETSEMKELMEVDSKKTQNLILQKRISSFNENYESEKKKLENFVLARKNDEFLLCKNFLKESIDDIINSNFENVDEALQQYEDISCFPSKHSKKGIGEYYSLECNKAVINLKNNLDTTLNEILQQIYTLSILQTKKYTSNDTSINQKNIIIEFSDVNQKSINLDFKSEKQSITKKEAELSHKLSDLRTAKDNESANSIELSKLENQKNSEYYRHLRETRDIENSLNNIGNRPLRRVWYTTETRTRQTYRGGLGFLDWLCGPKTETYEYSVEHNNDEEIIKWDQKNASLISQKINENERHNEVQRNNQRKIDGLKRIKAANEEQARKIEKEIQRLSQEIKDDKNDLVFLEKNAKRELLNNTKNELKELISKKCMESYDSLIDYLRNVFENNIPKIIALTIDTYDKAISAKINMLRKIIEGNEKELFSKYEANDKDLKELQSILQIINN